MLGASTILGQYYNFIRFGHEGYRSIMMAGMANAAYLRQSIQALHIFDIVDKAQMPLVAFALKPEINGQFSVFDIQECMKKEGWIIPAYTCSKGKKICLLNLYSQYTHFTVTNLSA